MLETDPPKYHYMYQQLARIMRTYSPDVQMKSIDEGIIDFHTVSDLINHRRLEDIGYEIKRRLKSEVGSWMKVNIGIGTNRFLAKTAASLHKPDGLDLIDKNNLLDVYRSLKLTDLTGIASHYEARLNAVGVFSPIQFLETSSDVLRRLVFRSVVGEDWYRRLRGYEVDGVATKLGSVGRQWVLKNASNDDNFVLPCFHYLCETTAKKLRYQAVDARGLLVWTHFQTGDDWYLRKMFKVPFYTDQDLYQRALYLFNQRPKNMIIQSMGLTCYKLTLSSRNQVSLLDDVNQEDWLTTAIDEINERYGNFMIFSASSLLGKKIVRQKIPFGGTKYFDLLLQKD